MEYNSTELEHWAMQAKEEEKRLIPFCSRIGVGTVCDTIIGKLHKLRLDCYEGGMQKQLHPLYVRMQKLWLQHIEVLEDHGVYDKHERFERELLEPEPDPDTGRHTEFFRTIVNSVRLQVCVPMCTFSIPPNSPITILSNNNPDSEDFIFSVPVVDSDTPSYYVLHPNTFPARGILIKK